MAERPRLIYGTAWKKEATRDLVMQAIELGFRAIDTACQPKHYREDLVGEAISAAIDKGICTRESLFIQTKFTAPDGQDLSKEIPYNRDAPLEDQVRQSVARSCHNLRSSYIDSLLLHSPMRRHSETMKVWHVLEEFVQKGVIKRLGISNIYDPQELLNIITEAQSVKPSFVQNRFYAESGFDVEIRKICDQNGLEYQSFWTLTANLGTINSPVFAAMAKQRGVTPAQLFYRFMVQLGVSPLTGTTNSQHMKEDLAVLSIEPLSDDEMTTVKGMLFRI